MFDRCRCLSPRQLLLYFRIASVPLTAFPVRNAGSAEGPSLAAPSLLLSVVGQVDNNASAARRRQECRQSETENSLPEQKRRSSIHSDAQRERSPGPGPACRAPRPHQGRAAENTSQDDLRDRLTSPSASGKALSDEAVVDQVGVLRSVPITGLAFACRTIIP